MAIAVDSSGNAYVTGGTDSPDFPVTSNAYQPQRDTYSGDVFVSVLGEAGGGIWNSGPQVVSLANDNGRPGSLSYAIAQASDAQAGSPAKVITFRGLNQGKPE